MEPVRLRRRNGKMYLTLAGQLDVAHCRRMVERLNTVLSPTQPIVLDISKVERVDTAALQALVSFSRTVDARGLALTWKGVSEGFQKEMNRLGLAKILQA